MEEGLFLSFSSLIASMLLYKEYVTSIEVINLISLLVNENIFIDDEIDDGIDSLLLCVDCPNLNYFKIKDKMSYDTCLFERVTVRDFLITKSSSCILEFIDKNEYLKKTSPHMFYKVRIINDKCN